MKINVFVLLDILSKPVNTNSDKYDAMVINKSATRNIEIYRLLPFH